MKQTSPLVGLPSMHVPEEPSLTASSLAVMAALTFFSSSQTILTALSKVGGKYLYDFSTLPLLAEIFKMAVCCVALFLLFLIAFLRGGDSVVPKVSFRWRGFMLYPIPSIIYLLLNNLHFVTLSHIDPASFQVLNNLKIVTTAILFRLFLQRKLSHRKWFALGLLTFGTSISQLKFSSGPVNSKMLASSASALTGVIFSVTAAWLSAAAGVYTEYLLKRDTDSIYWQNLQLYFSGTLVNVIALSIFDLYSNRMPGYFVNNMFVNYNFFTWLLLGNMVMMGFAVSWLIKHASILVKVYASSVGMLATTVFSSMFLDYHPTMQLLAGILLTGFSVYMYFR